MECKGGMNKASKLLLGKCPLKYFLVRNLACFVPREIGRDKLDNAKRVKAKDCDGILWHYNQFVG